MGLASCACSFVEDGKPDWLESKIKQDEREIRKVPSPVATQLGNPAQLPMLRNVDTATQTLLGPSLESVFPLGDNRLF